MWRCGLAMVCVACVAPDVDEVVVDEGWTPVALADGVAGPPPPQTMTLTGSSTVYTGGPHGFAVSGPDLEVGDNILLFVGRGVGSGRCYPSGICIELEDVIGAFRSEVAFYPSDVPFFDDATEARFSGDVPRNVADGTFYLQAFRVDGAATEASDIRTVTVDNCVNGTMATQFDVQRVQHCTVMASISFQQGFRGPASFPNLQTLSSDIGGNELAEVTRIDVPELTSVRSLLTVYPTLTELNAPALRSAMFTVSIRGTAVDTVDLSSLETVGANLFWSPAATTASLPSLVSVGATAGFEDLPALQTIDLPLLNSVGTLEIGRNPSLQTVDLPALQTAEFVSIDDHPSLTSIAMPSYDFGSLLIRRNDALTTIDAGSFGELRNQLFVVANPQLSSLALSDTPSASPVGAATKSVRLLNNGAWCYDGPVDWTTVAPAAEVDTCP